MIGQTRLFATSSMTFPWNNCLVSLPKIYVVDKYLAKKLIIDEQIA